MIVVGFALLVIEQQTDYALLIDWPRRRGCFTLEADELLIEAELAALFSIQRCFAVCRFFHSQSVLQSRKSA
jgi:hypothetical protein